MPVRRHRAHADSPRLTSHLILCRLHSAPTIVQKVSKARHEGLDAGLGDGLITHMPALWGRAGHDIGAQEEQRYLAHPRWRWARILAET